MPTINPRVNVTLSPSLHSLVANLATHQRVSKSMVLRELLEAVEPQLAQAVAFMEAAQKANGEARKQISRNMEAGIKEAQEAVSVALEKTGALTRDLVAQAEVIRGRRPARKVRPGVASERASGGRKRSPTPLPSNRGVKS